LPGVAPRRRGWLPRMSAAHGTEELPFVVKLLKKVLGPDEGVVPPKLGDAGADLLPVSGHVPRDLLPPHLEDALAAVLTLQLAQVCHLAGEECARGPDGARKELRGVVGRTHWVENGVPPVWLDVLRLVARQQQ
jgi:hypothetical protein